MVATPTAKSSPRWPWPRGLKSIADLIRLRLRFLRVFRLYRKWIQFRSRMAWTRLTSQEWSWHTLTRESESAPYMTSFWKSPKTHIWQLWNAIPWIRGCFFAPATVQVLYVRHSTNNSARSSIVRENSYKYKRNSSSDAIIQNERNPIWI